MKNSISNWEESYFGGFKKILNDYPEINSPFRISTKVPEHSGLGYYAKQKLTDIFQLKISEHNLIKMLLAGAKKEEETTFWSGKKRTYLVADAIAVSTVVNQIIMLDEELGNLFSYYKDVIERTEFSYEMENEEDARKGKEGEEGETKMSIGECRDQASALIKRVKARKMGVESEALTGALKDSVRFRVMEKIGYLCKYSTSEIVYSEQLLKLLDISFDPRSDKINNLRTGKISPDKIASVPAGNFHIYHRVEENQITKPFSVCILADESGSMNDGNRSTSQLSMMKILYKTFSQILPLDKIFIYGHSDYKNDDNRSRPEIRVYNDKYNQIFEQAIENQGRKGRWGENYDGPVIERVYEKIRSITSDNIIFITISDGQPSGENYGGVAAINGMKKIIEKCKRDGFVTLGIGIQEECVREIYNYNTVISNMKDMVKQVSLLINKVVKTEFQ